MRKLMSIAVVALASTLTIATAASPAQIDKPPTIGVSHAGRATLGAEIRAIQEVRDAWLGALNRDDLDSLLTAYRPGAVLNPESAPPMLGADGIVEWHRRFDVAADVQYELDATLVRLEDDFAVEEWTALVTVAAPPDSLAIGTEVFQYRQAGVRVYRKDAAGCWRIDRETWSADPPGVRDYERKAVADGCPWRVC